MSSEQSSVLNTISLDTFNEDELFSGITSRSTELQSELPPQLPASTGVNLSIQIDEERNDIGEG